MIDPSDLPGLVASRICHDLISPVGALGNGLELLDVTTVTDGEEMALIRDCATAARNSLTFMRIAFGAATNADVVSQAEVAKAAEPYMKSKRIALTWPADFQPESRLSAKAHLLLLLCAADALPRGGAVSALPSPSLGWQIVGEKMRPRAVIDALASGQSDAAVRPRDVHYPLVWTVTSALSQKPQFTEVSETKALIQAISG